MQTLALLALALLLAVRPDPTPGLTKPLSKARQLQCERLTPQSALERHPGEILPPKPRGDFVDRTVLVCAERIMRPGLRDARDEAILEGLHTRSAELAAAATSLHPHLEGRTWLVEAYYPNAQLSPKLVFAGKNALMDQGLAVSDRLVSLGAGDIDVLTRMAPDDAYPAACERYTTTSLGEGDALLALVHRDSRATTLHAGVCADGQWSWLR